MAWLSDTNSTPRENSPWIGRYEARLAGSQLVLDLGCGLGHDTLDLASSGHRVVGVDIDRGRTRRLPKDSGIIGLVVADISKPLPFAELVFDAVISSLALHYFDEKTTEQLFGEIARILKPDHLLLCRVNAVGDRNFGYGLGEEIEKDFFQQPDGRRKRFFTRQTLERFLTPCFTVELIVERTIKQHGRAKHTLECLARKR